MSDQKPSPEGIGIDYDPSSQILQLSILRDDGKPTYVVLQRDQALSFVQAILDTMGIGSKLLEFDPSKDPPH